MFTREKRKEEEGKLGVVPSFREENIERNMRAITNKNMRDAIYECQRPREAYSDIRKADRYNSIIKNGGRLELGDLVRNFRNLFFKIKES